jgi:uncharacterized protein involved in response to NO
MVSVARVRTLRVFTDPPPSAAVWWRTEPYRLFMPLGVALAWAGVSHWLLLGLGVIEQYRAVFHALVQVQGFLMAFAVGFLFTAIPRRTSSPAPATWQVAAAAACLVGSTVAAWFERWALSQAVSLILAVILLGFVLRRLAPSRDRRRPPASFVWIPIALLTGATGSALLIASGLMGEGAWRLHELGRGLLVHGMFPGLVVGVGGLAFPLMTRGEAPRDVTSSLRDRAILGLHLLGALALTATTWVQQALSLQLALLARGLILLLALLAAAGLWRRPRGPGLNRWLIWTAGWMLPTGYLLAALFPLRAKAGLHVAFIAGFALLTLTVGAQVILGHGGRDDLKRGRPWPLVIFAALMFLTLVPRTLVDFDPQRVLLWLTGSSALFLAATVVWIVFLAPYLWAPPRAVTPEAVARGATPHRRG